MRHAVVVAFTLTACLIQLGCSAPAHRAQFQPTLRWGTCPADIETTFLSPHRCGRLTVLENRARPGGPRVRLFVLKVWPVGVHARPGLDTAFGQNIGDPGTIDGDAATGATRMQRVSVQAEPRGAGLHSAPSLRCTETDSLQEQAAAARTGDASLTARFVAAVFACAKRLRAAGVDLNSYDANASAADTEDLRVTSGVGSWAVLGSYGTQSRTLFEYLRTHPGRARAAYLDSPWFPAVDELTGGAIGTRAALQALFQDCISDHACNRAHPHLQQTWRRALTRLATTSLRGPATRGDGKTIPVLVDAGKLLRMARFALGGDGPANLTQLPSIIEAAAAGRLEPHLATLVANDPLFCAGYRPLCSGQARFSLGTYLSTFCRDELPYIEPASLTQAVAGDPAYRAVFANSPYLAACKAWPVTQAPRPPQDPHTKAPLLLMSGQFDSFSPPALTNARAADFGTATSVTVPGTTHNVLGFADCALTIRNEWTFAPTVPVSQTCDQSTQLRYP